MKPNEYFSCKAYLVRYNRTTEPYMINKDGYFICWATSPEDAKSKIDQLVSKNEEVSIVTHHYINRPASLC